MNKITFPVLILVASLICVGVGITEYGSIQTNALTQNPSVVSSHAKYAADFSKDEVLVGASHNVFLGKVKRQIGAKERGIGPETQFEVEVIENVKGDLEGVAIINQQGGYKDGILYVVEEGDVNLSSSKDQYLLQPGSTYLFATRYNEEESWHTLNSFPTARKLISADPSLSLEELKMLANNNSRVNELRAAYPNETLLDADVQSGKTYNDYQTHKPLPQMEEKAEQPDVKAE